MICGMVPGIIISHPITHQFPKIFGIDIPKAYGPFQSGFKPLIIKIIKHIAITFMIWFSGVIRVKDCVCQSAGIPNNGNCSIFHGNHLCQARRS